jgi:hypothetical protein
MPRAVGLVFVAAFAGVALLSAQRGGWDDFIPHGARNVAYDGKVVFVRMSYPVSGFRREPTWAHDYPTGERHFMRILTTVTNVSAHVDDTNILAFGDPELFKFPVAYLVEPGFWTMTEEEVRALRAYLQKGGFLIVDDFPYWAWDNFSLQMSRVFPDGRWVDLDAVHPIFHSFFEIDTLDIVPAYPQLGEHPIYRALFEDNDPEKRMFVIANYQNDLSEFWEHSEQGFYPVDVSNEAYKAGINEFIYGILH